MTDAGLLVEENQHDHHANNHEAAKQNRKKAKLFLVIREFAAVSHAFISDKTTLN